MTTPSPPVPVPGPPELRVDATRVINSLKQRLLEEISRTVVLESALAEAQEHERILVLEVQRLQPAPVLPDEP